MKITSTNSSDELGKQFSKHTILALAGLSAIIFAVYMVSPYIAEKIAGVLGVVSMLFTMNIFFKIPKNLKMLKYGPALLLPLILFTVFGLSSFYGKEGIFTNTVMGREAIIDRIEISSNGKFLTIIGDSRYLIKGNFIPGDKVEISRVIYKKSDLVKHFKFCLLDTCSYGNSL